MSLEKSIKLAVETLGVNLYDIVSLRENDKNIYRVYISSPDGVSLDKCAEVSKMISPLLDVEEPMNGNYNLEVSSPGIERKLKKKNHFIASIGEYVRVKDVAIEVYKGKLIDADEEKIVIQTEFGEESISYDTIVSASTYYKW